MADAKKPIAKAEHEQVEMVGKEVIGTDDALFNEMKAELEKLKAENAKLAKASKAKAEEPKSALTPDELLEADRIKEEAKAKEMVPIYLIKDNNEYKTDVTVQINGRIWQIQRGQQIHVPKMVADVLKQSQHQDMLALDMIQKSSNVYLGER